MRLIVALVALLAMASPLRAEQFINILTGGTSGVYYPLGNALSTIYGEAIPGAKPTVQSTKASVENLNLLQAGRGEVAFSLGDSVVFAWNGDAEMGFKAKADKLRAIATLYPNYIQVVAAKGAGIRSLADLKGKRVSVGAPKSGTEVNARTVFAAAGLTYDDMQVQYLPFGESVELMKNRQLDATLQSAGLGVASIRDLANSIDIVIVAIPLDVVARINDPAYISGEIPAGTYQGQDAPVVTAAVNNILVTRSDLPDELVHRMTKAMFEHLADMVAAHSAAKVISLDTAAQGLPIPLHPGAQRFYKEKGILN